MNSIIEKLLILQEHDSKLRDLLKQAKDIPIRKEEEKSRLNAHQKAEEKVLEEQKAKQTDIKSVELEIKAKHDQVARLRNQQIELKTNKEFKAMETEIHAVEFEVSRLEDKELQLMEEFERLKADFEEKQKALKLEASVVDKDILVLDGRFREVEGEIAAMRQVRQAAAVGIDAQWLDRYQRVFERREKAVVALENGICGGCHMKVPPQVIQNTRRQSTAMVSCDHCGRLLYSVC